MEIIWIVYSIEVELQWLQKPLVFSIKTCAEKMYIHGKRDGLVINKLLAYVLMQVTGVQINERTNS